MHAGYSARLFAYAAFCVCLLSSPASSQTVWQYPTRSSGPCEFHPTPHGALAMILSVPAVSRDIKGDGRGRYFEGNDTVRSYANISYNFFAYWPETCDEPLPRRVRSLEFRLDRPHDGARSLGTVRDENAMMHVFTDGRRWLDLEVGSTVSSPTTLLRFQLGGTIHFLRFGGESPVKNLANPPLRAPASGSTTVRITRIGKTKWKVAAGEHSVGRLSSWKPDEFVDLGLYGFSFDLELDLQRLDVDSLVDGNFQRQSVAK